MEAFFVPRPVNCQSALVSVSLRFPGAREGPGGRTLRKDVFLPSKHLLSAIYETLPSKSPSKNLVSTKNPYRRLLRTLLRSVQLHDPNDVHPSFFGLNMLSCLVAVNLRYPVRTKRMRRISPFLCYKKSLSGCATWEKLDPDPPP